MTRRIVAKEKFPWRGWEFRQSLSTSREVHWRMKHGKIEVRLVYRDIQDPDAPPEWTALIHMHGLVDGVGKHTAGAGCSEASFEEALLEAERDFEQKLVAAVRLLGELRRGKPRDP